MSDDSTYPLPHFKDATVQVWKWINNFIPHFTGYVLIYPCWDKSSSMIVLDHWGVCLFSCHVGPTSQKHHCITVPFRESNHWPMFPHHKGTVMRKAFHCQDIMWQFHCVVAFGPSLAIDCDFFRLSLGWVSNVARLWGLSLSLGATWCLSKSYYKVDVGDFIWYWYWEWHYGMLLWYHNTIPWYHAFSQINGIISDYILIILPLFRNVFVTYNVS